MQIAVLGAGAWGTAVAIQMARHHEVTLWARHEDHAAAMQLQRTNARYLPGADFPEGLRIRARRGYRGCS